MSQTTEAKKPGLGLAFLVFVGVAAIISLGILKLGQDAHIPIVLAATLAAVVGRFVLGIKWSVMEEGVISAIASAMQAIVILLIIGMLIGIWMKAGVVPGMIYYGLDLLSPSIFLLATLLICSIVSLATGTSWGTTGTVGIALMGIAMGLGIPAPLSAGIIISGAYFGDKMSPLSDTTNLAPAVSGATLFDHIRAMVWTTGPTYVIVAVITIVLGMKYGHGTLDVSKIEAIQAIMGKEFSINLACFLPPLLVIGTAVAKIPAIPGLVIGVAAGGIIAAFQGISIPDLIGALHYGYSAGVSAQIGDAADLAAVGKLLAENGLSLDAKLAQDVGKMLNDLLTRGGLDGMMWSISLVFAALTLGGIMERCGYLETLLGAMLKGVRTAGGLIAAVIASCFLSNVFLGDQYLSLVIPGRMFKTMFEKSGLAPRMLSRSLEDCGTITSPLVPWNTCGAYQTTTLGVPTLAYAPYAFLNYLNPLMAILLTYMGIGIYWGKSGSDKVEKRTKLEFAK